MLLIENESNISLPTVLRAYLPYEHATRDVELIIIDSHTMHEINHEHRE